MQRSKKIVIRSPDRRERAAPAARWCWVPWLFWD